MVISMSAEDKEAVATVEGKMSVPSQEVLEAVETPILGPKEWLPTPNSVGMEELTRVTLGTGLNSLGLIAGHVLQPTQTRIRCVPTATIVFSEIIAMRE